MSWTILNDYLLDASNLYTDICKTIFVIFEVQFHHEGGFRRRQYFELFSSNDSYYYHTKSALSEPPFRLVFTFVTFLAIFTLSTQAENNFGRNLVHDLHKNSKLSVLGVPWVRNNRLLLDFFGMFKNPIEPFNLLCNVGSW